MKLIIQQTVKCLAMSISIGKIFRVLTCPQSGIAARKLALLMLSLGSITQQYATER